MKLEDIETIDGVPVKFVGILKDDGLNECMRCGHESNTHAEFEVESADEAEVVCPNCGSMAYFVKEK
jgi:DNA-directed RNA polymerase subunit RPC12/RpoP